MKGREHVEVAAVFHEKPLQVKGCSFICELAMVMCTSIAIYYLPLKRVHLGPGYAGFLARFRKFVPTAFYVLFHFQCRQNINFTISYPQSLELFWDFWNLLGAKLDRGETGFLDMAAFVDRLLK